MKLLTWICFLGSLFATGVLGIQKDQLFCYLDSESFSREGLAKFTIADLERAQPYCTHLVYGYLGILRETFEVSMVAASEDSEQLLSEVIGLKSKFPQLKVLLSVGGDRDDDNQYPNKYIQLLEEGYDDQQKFVNSAYSFVKKHGFDGLDLAYQFPRNRPIPVMGWFASTWRRIVNFFSSETPVDPKAYEHKQQFTDLVGYFNDSLRKEGLMFGVTVLPNVNSTWYFDIPKLNNLVDFVNVAAFDFMTPLRNPEEADYTAPLYHTHGATRDRQYNVEFHTNIWIENGLKKSKLILGIPAHGSAWKLTEESCTDCMPLVRNTNGPAPAGPQSKISGILSYAEICVMLSNRTQSPLHHKDDEFTFFGTYAWSAKDAIWISYEDARTADTKSLFAHSNRYGGVSVLDLSYDDFHGLCNGVKFPLLRAVSKVLTPYRYVLDLEEEY